MDKDLAFSSHTTLKIDEAKRGQQLRHGLIGLYPYNQPLSRWAQARMISPLHHVSANDRTLLLNVTSSPVSSHPLIRLRMT
jgi:hypothetical protein